MSIPHNQRQEKVKRKTMSKKYDGIVLLTDMDGTLLDPNRQLANENLEAIRFFMANGGRFGVATGRTEATLAQRFPQLPTNIPCIFFNGALVYDPSTGNRLYENKMPAGLESIFIDIMKRYPSCGVEINAHGKAYVFNENDIIRTQLNREGIRGEYTCWDAIEPGWYKALIIDKHEVLVKVKAELEAMNREDIEITFSEQELLDILAKNVSKGKALAELRKAQGNHWKLVVALGDNDNDVDMLKTADIGIAVANARDAAKAAAARIIGPHTDPVIPRAIEIIDSLL